MKNNSNKLSSAVGILVVIITWSGCSKVADRWPQFRGVNCSGIAALTAKPPEEFSENNLLWSLDLPLGHSSPVIWGDNIFVTGCVPEEKKLEMFCINRKDGKVMWQHTLPVLKFENVHSSVGNAAHASAVTDGERAYFYFGSYGLICYDLNGKLLWEKKFPVANGRYGTASSPVLYNEKLILCREEFGNSRLYAFNKLTGDSLWGSGFPERAEMYDYPSYSTPVIWNNLIVIHRMFQVTAHSTEDGSVKWWAEIPTNGNSTPVFKEDLLFFGAWYEFSEKEQRGEIPGFAEMINKYDEDKDGKIKKEEIPEKMILMDRPGNDLQNTHYLRSFYGRIDTDKNGKADEKEWNDFLGFLSGYTRDGGLFAIRPGNINGKLPDNVIAWTVNDRVPEVPSPIYYENLVYMCKDGGIITCMDSESGKIVYRERINAPGSYIASPVIADGKIYITSAKGVVTVIKAGNKFEVLKQSNLKENVFATPAIIRNNIYIRTQDHLLAFK
jgi:outer membrane protein assembly factor BamB